MALTLLAANNAQTVLAAGISSSATSLTVNAGTGILFPAPVSGTSYFKLTLIDAATGTITEIVHVTARDGDVFTIQRAREGTTARAWSANDIAANMMTAGTLDVMAQKDLSLQIANSLSEIAAAGPTAVAAALANLGLGDASGYVGRLINTRVFTSSNTYTPTPGTKRIRVTITGGGGGGGGCQASASNETFFGAGGGAGGTIISIMTLTEGSFSVVIGAGGSGGAGAWNGGYGGDSSFASLIAPGGAGGGKSSGSSTNGGAGGVPNTGDIRIIGGYGGDGQSGNVSVSGAGGASHWGGGGRAGTGAGISGRAYGSGGGSAYDAGYSGTSMTGGKGAAGICIIEEFA